MCREAGHLEHGTRVEKTCFINGIFILRKHVLKNIEQL